MIFIELFHKDFSSLIRTNKGHPGVDLTAFIS